LDKPSFTADIFLIESNESTIVNMEFRLERLNFVKPETMRDIDNV